MSNHTTVQIAGLKFYFSPLTSLESGILPLIDSWVDEDSEEVVLKAASVKRKLAELETDATSAFFATAARVSSLQSEHAEARLLLSKLDADSVKDTHREECLRLSKELEQAESELMELAEGLTPADVEAIEQIKHYRRRHESLTTTIGTHAMHGQLMACYTVVKDVLGDDIEWPKFSPGVPPRKILDQRMFIVESRTTPGERSKLLEAAGAAMNAGVAGLTDDEKKP